MLFLKKLLILLLALLAMYVAYIAVNFFKEKIKVQGNMGAFLLLLLFSFITIFVIIAAFGFLLVRFKDFFFKV